VNETNNPASAPQGAPGAASDPTYLADEFAGIPSRRGRHPVLAVAAIALALFLGFKLRADLAYALSATTPLDLGDARDLAGRSSAALPVNRYVRLAGRADRESAVILDTQGSWQFRQLFRLLGTGNRFFVRRAPDPLPVELAEKDTFTGLLIRLEDLSFAPAIRRHFVAHVSATHFFAPRALHQIRCQALVVDSHRGVPR
jgi:hypothetical protein